VTPPSPASPPRATPLPSGVRPATALLLLVIFGLPLVLGTPLLDPDEGLHAAIAQEMVERGDWITPRFLGEPFLDKPILFFWGLAASVAALGATEFAIKLPGLLFGLAGAAAAGLFARRLGGATTGHLALAFHATMLLPFALAEAAVHDVALVPCTTLAMLALWDASCAPGWRAALTSGVVAGVWLGLAVLTKALTGVVLIGLPLVLWALATRRLTVRLMAAGVLSLVVGALVAAPWYALMEAANPGYLHYYIVERHLFGFATTTQLHGQRPWWYYLPVLAGGALPWIAYLPAAWTAGRTRGSAEAGLAERWRDGLRLAWFWLVADLIFLSLAGSKLMTYLLPAFPAVAAIAAAAWTEGLRHDEEAGTARRRWPVMHVAGFLPLAVVLPAALALAPRFDVRIGAPVWVAAVAASIGWLAVAGLGMTRPRADVLRAALWSFAITGALGLGVILPAVAPTYSAREVARRYNALGRVPGQLWFFDERVGSFLYYLDPALRSQMSPVRLQRVRPEIALTTRHPPADTEIVIPVEELPRLRRRLPLDAQPSVVAGHHRIYTAEAFAAALNQAVGAR
jgi:4-amino-4-deoxy-L-arabinose transferase-like glycosyltransferase